MKYKAVYADCPWAYRVYARRGRGSCAENYYRTMDIEDIKALPVEKIVADDSILFLWVTFPCLLQGLEVMGSWGFAYKTCGFVWVKRNRKSDGYFTGLGFWTRSNAEICLIGTRGHPKRVSKSVKQICDARIMEHSRKPAEIRERIVELCGDVPRIELFARERADAWDALGDEVDGMDIRESLQQIIDKEVPKSKCQLELGGAKGGQEEIIPPCPI